MLFLVTVFVLLLPLLYLVCRNLSAKLYIGCIHVTYIIGLHYYWVRTLGENNKVWKFAIVITNDQYSLYMLVFLYKLLFHGWLQCRFLDSTPQKAHASSEIINENWVSADSENITETASTADTWTRQRKQLLWAHKSSTKTEHK